MQQEHTVVQLAKAQQFLARQRALREQCQKRVDPRDWFDWETPGYTIPGRFAEMVERYPDNLAVLDDVVTLTYRELDSESNCVANALLAEGKDGPGFIGLFVSSSAMALIAMLGVVKAGKAYLGFDDVLPEGRFEQILNDADCVTVMSDREHTALAQRSAANGRHLIHLDHAGRYPTTPPQVEISPDMVAALIYSSGSTGRPKGIVHTHHSVVAQAAAYMANCHLNSADRVANFSTLAWAATFWRYCGTLFFGAAVATIDPRRRNTEQIIQWLAESAITLMSGRANIRRIMDAAGERRLHSVRLISIGGDTIYRHDIEACRRVFPEALVAVGLGMTEAGRTTDWIIDAGTALDEVVVHVGLPAPGYAIRLLDDEGQDVGTGGSGEIAIESYGLAQGYWKQPELTAEKFRQSTSSSSPRVYLTGDVGRFGADGALWHLSRKDFQIKIRGYQVPANEIEGLLLAQPGIHEACVMKRHARDGHELLVAYIVVAPDFDLKTDDLQSALAAELPAYMTPHQIVIVPYIPQTPSMKPDRNRLPAPDRVRPRLQTPFVAPALPVEKRLAAIWEEILDITPVGINDEFVALGGDSLRAAQVSNRLVTDFDMNLPVTELLVESTVASMAARVVEHMIGLYGTTEARLDLD